jgi:hypothetical protein
MKKIFLILFLWSITRVYAQDTISVSEIDTFRMTESTFVDSAYGNLDTNRISTKYLLDRTLMNFGAGKFSGLADSTDSVKQHQI